MEKVLAVKTAERVAANRGAVPPFMQNDTYVVVQITDDPAYAYVKPAHFSPTIEKQDVPDLK